MTPEHGYITVIFCAEKGETVSDIIRTKDWSIASWSNAIHERDALKAELEAALSQAEADRVDAERYRWIKSNCGRFPEEYGAPQIRLGEMFDYADEASIDSDTDRAMEEDRLTKSVKTEG